MDDVIAYDAATVAQVTSDVNRALTRLKPSDRNGFLFGMMIKTMIMAGYTKEMIEKEIKEGLDLCFQIEKPTANHPG